MQNQSSKLNWLKKTEKSCKVTETKQKKSVIIQRAIRQYPKFELPKRPNKFESTKSKWDLTGIKLFILILQKDKQMIKFSPRVFYLNYWNKKIKF